MLWIVIAVLMLVLWSAGMLTSYTLGGVIHVLLIIALVALVVRLTQRRRAAS
jgi:Family of unknown function (DUF5670)